MNPTNILDRELFSYLVDDARSPEDHLLALAAEMAGMDARFEPLADVKKLESDFYRIMVSGEFLPETGILTHGVRNNPVLLNDTAFQLSDDFDEIFQALRKTSLFLQNGVRVGLDFSPLRAERSLIRSSHLQSVGPVRFMELFEKAPQAGDERLPLRFILNVDHLDIENYLHYAAAAPSHIRCGIGLTREFCQAYLEDRDIGLRYRSDSEISKSIPARTLYESLRSIARQNSGLDLLFTDAIKEFFARRFPDENILRHPQGVFAQSGEFVAGGVINLMAFVHDGEMDYDRLAATMTDAVHFLDNVFEKNFYFDEESRDATRRNLRLSIGVAGLEEALNALEPDGDETRQFRLMEKMAQILREASLLESQRLGDLRGARHRTEYKGKTLRTRHREVLSQSIYPLLNQILNVPSYLFRRGMGFTGLQGMFRKHRIWQNQLENAANFRLPVKALDEPQFDALFAQACELGVLALELG